MQYVEVSLWGWQPAIWHCAPKFAILFRMKKNTSPSQIVHIVSHGPYCLDGVAAAVAVARYRADAQRIPHFFRKRAYQRCPTNDWTRGRAARQRAVDHRYLLDSERNRYAPAGPRKSRSQNFSGLIIIVTALKRYAAGDINVPFAAHTVSEEFSAARLVYQYLEETTC